jgi:GT2 family glycosyltransferase
VVPSVSVIVPIFNGVTFLPAFFDSLRVALPEDAQLILVDDGSSEPVWDTVPEMASALSVVRLQNDGNFGYSAAANRGFAAASGDILVQLNTDLVLDPDCIRAMIELIETEQRVGIVGSKLVYPTSGLVQHVGMALGNHTKTHVYSELPSDHPLCSRTRAMQVLTGATVAMTRQVFERIGSLEERYFNHNEDVEHCLLAARQGYRNFTCADSVAYHWESHSGPARFARVMSSEALFWSRWGNAYEPDLGRFVDEALEHLLQQAPEIEGLPFDVLDLSRGPDQPIVIDRLSERWPGVPARVRRFRQMNNPSEQLSLPLLLPHWLISEPVPFIYLVDRYRELEENVMWFKRRRSTVEQELIVDLTGAALLAEELAR